MFNLDKRTMYIIMTVLIVLGLIQYISSPDKILSLLLTAPGVLIAITFHEFAHGYAAYKLGDDTAKNDGRLSLNPFAHLDPVGTLMLLVAGFGWGKPVVVNPRNYNRNISVEKADAIVSFAGPAMNFVLALVFTFIYYALIKFAGSTFLYSTIGSIIITIVKITISINIGLGVFNLIPLPPLDGSKIIMPLLPYNAKEFFINNEQIFYIIFILIWITGIAGYIITPLINLIGKGFFSLGRLIFRI